MINPLEMSALNDGICDCCAGEDEWNSGTICVDRCKKESEEQKRSHPGSIDTVNGQIESSSLGSGLLKGNAILLSSL